MGDAITLITGRRKIPATTWMSRAGFIAMLLSLTPICYKIIALSFEYSVGKTFTKKGMTGSEINHSFLFHGVLKNLTACGMLRISIARCQIEAEIHSFPTMYIMGGVDMFEMGQIDDFVPKIGPKSCFFRDTNLVLPTLGGSGTPKF